MEPLGGAALREEVHEPGHSLFVLSASCVQSRADLSASSSGCLWPLWPPPLEQ